MADQQDADKAVKVVDQAVLAMEQLLIGGDLKLLTPPQRLQYYKLVCESLGLNYLTRPFEYITVNGKTILYARRDATDQLRKNHEISITITNRERFNDVYVVTAQARTADGRTDEAIGAISILNLKGLELANALMKCETKAKRRVTLSIVGLGWSDETEVDSIVAAGKQKQLPQRATAPGQPKFSELPDDAKREFLRGGWKSNTDSLRERGIEEDIPEPDFRTTEIDLLVQAAKLLTEAKKAQEVTKISELLQAVRDLLGISVKEPIITQEEIENAIDQPTP